MKKFMAFGLATLSLNLYATYLPDPCITNLNFATRGFSFNSPIHVDGKGKLIVDKKKVTSYEEKGNAKTIIYKEAGSLYGSGELSRKVEVIEENGKIVRTIRYEDTGAQDKWQKDNKLNFPLIKKTEQVFIHDSESCKLVSSEMTEDGKGKESVTVTYDKKLCDEIAPLLNQMGKQNAMLCTGLFSKIQQSYLAREDEFSKSGKGYRPIMGGFVGAPLKSIKDLAGTGERETVLIGVISACAMVENPMMPGIGMGGGFGMGMSVVSPTTPPAAASK